MPKVGKTSYARILKLGEERVDAINTMLAKGESPLFVARVIQQDWKEYTDVSEDSLKRQLIRYRQDKVASTVYIAAAEPEERKEILQKLKNNLDVIHELSELAILQKSRITQAVAREQKVGLPFNWLTKDISELRDIYMAIGKMQMDTGAVPRVFNPQTAVGIQVNNNGGAPAITATQMQLQNAATEVIRILEGESEVIDEQ